ncbi:MAG: hypothetical protein EOM25_11890 [Deltaproteobacteria bacterium]|nr:hypothetical protein [Deltaproteobacteria bacterium]
MKWKTIAMSLVAAPVLVVAVGLATMNQWINAKPVQDRLAAMVGGMIGLPMDFGSLEIDPGLVTGIELRDLQIGSAPGPEVGLLFLRVDLEVWPLLIGRPAVRVLDVEGLDVRFGDQDGRTASDRAGAQDVPSPELDLEALHETLVRLESVRVTESRVQLGAIVIEDLDVSMTPSGQGGLILALKSLAELDGQACGLEMNGTAIPQGRVMEVLADLVVTEFPLALTSAPPEYDVQNGSALIRAEIRGTLPDELYADLKALIHGYDFSVEASGRTKAYHFPVLTAVSRAEARGRTIRLTDMALSGFDLNANGSMSIDFTRPRDPVLDLVVSTASMNSTDLLGLFPDPVVPAEVVEEVFPMILGGSVRLDRFFLNGPVSRIGNLDEKANADTLGAELAFEDVGIELDPKGPVVEGVNGSVSYQGGVVTVRAESGRVLNSTVDRFDLNIGNVYDDGLLYDFSGRGGLALSDLIHFRDVRFVTEEVADGLGMTKDLGGTVDWDAHGRIGTGKTNATLTCRPGPVLVPVEGMPAVSVESGEVKIVLSEGGGREVFIRDLGGRWGQTTWSGNGTLTGSSWVLLADVHGRVDVEEVQGLGGGKEPWIAAENSTDYALTIKGTPGGLLEIDGGFDMAGWGLRVGPGVLRAVQGDRLDVSLTYHPRAGVVVDRAVVGLGGASVRARGRIEPSPETRVSGSVVLESLHLGRGVWEGGNATHGLAGTLSGEVAFSLAPDRPESLSANGTVEGRGLRLPLPGEIPVVHNLDFDLGFLDRELDLSSFSMQIGANPVYGHGQFFLGLRTTGRVYIRSPHLDVGKIVDAALASTGGRGEQPRKEGSRSSWPYEVVVETFVDAGRYKELRFGPFHALGRVTDGSLLVDRARLDLPAGVVALESRDGGHRGYLELQDQPMNNMMVALGADQEKSLVDGPLRAKGYVFVRPKRTDRPESFADRVDGALTMEIGRGFIRKSNVMAQVLHFLNIQNILSLNFSTLEEGIPFETIEGYFHIRKGIAKTEDFTVSSPVLNVATEGELRLKDMTVEARLAVQPFGTVDSLVSKIPIAGYILTGQDKSLVSYYFRVQGPLKDPEVTYVPFVDLPASVLGYFKRILLTPVRVFDQSRVDEEMKRDRIEPPDWLSLPPGVISLQPGSPGS